MTNGEGVPASIFGSDVGFGALCGDVLTLRFPLPESGFCLPHDLDLVQFTDAPSQRDLLLIASELEKRPEIGLRVYGSTGVANLEFLRYFPFITRLILELRELQSIEGLSSVPLLESLFLGRTKTRALSLEPLQRLSALADLGLEAQHKDIAEVLDGMPIRDLQLRSISLPDVKFTARLPKLSRLEIKLGGTANLADLAVLRDLRQLGLWRIRGLTDISWLGSLVRLETLFLQTLNGISSLPSLAALKQLRSVHLETMKGVRDLSGIASAPNLQELALVDMVHLSADSLAALKELPTLRKVSGGPSTLKKYAEA
jgi:Leucine-rich repeat (LRR) protein